MGTDLSTRYSRYWRYSRYRAGQSVADGRTGLDGWSADTLSELGGTGSTASTGSTGCRTSLFTVIPRWPDSPGPEQREPCFSFADLDLVRGGHVFLTTTNQRAVFE